MQANKITENNIISFTQYLHIEEKSAVTIEKYLRGIRAFFVFIGEEAVVKEKILEYKASLVEKGYAIASINSMLASVNSFLHYMGWADCRVKMIKKQREAYCAEEKELSKQEYLRLLEVAGEDRRLRLVIQTICATGIRVSELRFFTVEAVTRGTVTVQCINKTRKVFVPYKLKKQLLQTAAAKKITGGAIFITRSGNPLDRSYIWARMKRLCETAGVNAAVTAAGRRWFWEPI